jgi:hypothetical protein
MNTAIATISLITGGWLIGNAMALHTQNFKSSLIFKIIPMALGLCSLFGAVKLFGWI